MDNKETKILYLGRYNGRGNQHWKNFPVKEKGLTITGKLSLISSTGLQRQTTIQTCVGYLCILSVWHAGGYMEIMLENPRTANP